MVKARLTFLIALLVIPLVAQAEVWKYEKFEDDFDDSIQYTAIIEGHKKSFLLFKCYYYGSSHKQSGIKKGYVLEAVLEFGLGAYVSGNDGAKVVWRVDKRKAQNSNGDWNAKDGYIWSADLSTSIFAQEITGFNANMVPHKPAGDVLKVKATSKYDYESETATFGLAGAQEALGQVLTSCKE